MKIYILLIRNLFYFFLIATIFNPYLKSTTLYLYIFLPLFDPLFLKQITNIKIKREIVVVLPLIFFLIFFGGISLFIKALALFIVVSYIIYTYSVNHFFLYRYFILSSLLALSQFILLFINKDVAIALGPTNLSHLVLGDFAGPSFTNFYELFFLPRVSGLSREAGFFASLVVVLVLIYVLDRKISSKFMVFNLLISYIISFSKASLGIISFVFLKFKIHFNVFGRVTFIFWVYMMIMQFIISPLIIEWALVHNGETFLHRFGGYYLMNFLSFKEYLFGHVNMNNYLDYSFVDEVWRFVENGNWTGWSFLILKIGIVPMIILIYLLELIGFNLRMFFILTILTFNTNPLTISNQVVLVYFVFYLMIYNDKIEEYKKKC